jgi:3-phenylpropionate/cinnamic acid dioxygenase small subunit
MSSGGQDGADIDDELRLWFRVQRFLVAEAALLDHHEMDRWLDLLTDDVRVVAPVRITRRRGQPTETDMMLLDETRQTLGLRIRRLSTDVAWSEDPPSRTRRFVSNVSATWSTTQEVHATSSLLVYRNRGDHFDQDLLSAQRSDTLSVLADGSLRIRSRTILIDQATIGTKNLGIVL